VQAVKSNILETAVMVVFLVLMGFLSAAFTVLFLLFFVPVAGWFIWKANGRTKELEQRLSKLEKPPEQKSEES
jgi:nicotinamide riboside transporter PnuC